MNIAGSNHIRQLYLRDTNNLVTCFLAEEGVVEVIDCMPIHDEASHPSQIVRLVSLVGRTRGSFERGSQLYLFGSVTKIWRRYNRNLEATGANMQDEQQLAAALRMTVQQPTIERNS